MFPVNCAASWYTAPPGGFGPRTAYYTSWINSIPSLLGQVYGSNVSGDKQGHTDQLRVGPLLTEAHGEDHVS